MAELREELRELELALLRPSVRRDPPALSKLLADEFREFASSGRVLRKADVIEALQNEDARQFEVSDLSVSVICEHAALVTFRLYTHERPGQPGRVSFRSSLWVRGDDSWQMLFHQGTPASSAGDARP